MIVPLLPVRTTEDTFGGCEGPDIKERLEVITSWHTHAHESHYVCNYYRLVRVDLLSSIVVKLLLTFECFESSSFVLLKVHVHFVQQATAVLCVVAV